MVTTVDEARVCAHYCTVCGRARFGGHWMHKDCGPCRLEHDVTTVDEAREALLAMTPLTEHELVELRTWTAGVNHTSRALVERVIDEAECARFALNEVAIHLEGLQHIRKLTPTEQAVLAQVRDGLRAAHAATPAEDER